MKKATGNARFVSHILILLLCVIIGVVATFSWYSRSTQESLGTAGLLTYTQSGNISGNGCTVETFAGTIVDGDVSYSTEPLSTEITSEPGALNYFKTVLTDVSNAPQSYVSVYLENFTYSQSLGENSVHIGITQPEKTYKQFNATASGSDYTIGSLCLEDNIIITSGNTIEIYWFVEIDGNAVTNGSISPGTLHIVYN